MSEHGHGIRVVEVPEWPKPKGFANGVITEGRRLLHVAGQVGWNAEQRFESDDFARQFAQALDNVLAVVRAAGGVPEGVVRMTVYVTDLAAYRAAQRALGAVWRERFGRHFPAMALVGVAGLVEEAPSSRSNRPGRSTTGPRPGGSTDEARGAVAPAAHRRRRPRRARPRAPRPRARSPSAHGCASSRCRSGRSRPSATTSSGR